jgi:hypothetical protein
MAMQQSYQDRRKQRTRKGGLLGFLLAPRLRGFLRVALYVTLVCCVVGIFAARSAMGGVSEQALVVGRQLSKLEDLTESSNRLLINGERINLASAVTNEPLEKVLDRFETLCRSEGVVSQEFARLDKVLKESKVPEHKTAFDLGILRKETDQDGMVACMVEEPGNKRSAFAGLERFMDSQDLRDIGLLRYAYARKTDRGNTHVLTAWTDGSFKLSAMMPEADGTDTPGTDPAGALRPPQSVRLLSASVQGAPHAVRIYESTAAPKDVLATYEREMPKLGWQPLKAAEYDVPEARYYSKGGVDLLVVADENGEHTAVSMVETRSR